MVATIQRVQSPTWFYSVDAETDINLSRINYVVYKHDKNDAIVGAIVVFAG